jgi:hypothetical protein
MAIYKLFQEASRIIEEECRYHGNKDLKRQWEIIRTKSCPRLTEEPDILNNLIVQASSYSVVRKYFQVFYPDDIYRFDLHFSSKYFSPRSNPEYDHEGWTRIVLSWGNKLLGEAGIAQKGDLRGLVYALKAGKANGLEELNPLKPRTRIVLAMATALPVLKREILDNTTGFYNRCDAVSSHHPGKAFDYSAEFSKNIEMMGTGLVCNFFKELGLPYYVKVDVHVKDFLDDITLQKLSEKRQFILSWLLAGEANMEPFFLDKILYVGGKYAKPRMKTLFQQYRNEYSLTIRRLLTKIEDFMD